MPKYDPVEKLVNRVNTSDGFNGDAVLAFMAETRQLLECKKLSSDYPLVNLYCNWCFHPELSRLNTVYRLLEQITDIFLREKKLGAGFIREVNDLLSMEGLRREMQRLFESQGIPDFWISIDENWHGFRARLLSNVVKKPIRFPPTAAEDAVRLEKGQAISGRRKKIAEIFTRIEGKGRGLGAVSLCLDDAVPEKPAGHVYWEVEISKGRTTRSRLLYSNFKSEPGTDPLDVG